MEQRNENKTELKMIKMSDVQSQTVDWLWYPFIPYGKLTIIQGDPGDGKTTLVLNIAARLSKGEGLDNDMKVTEPVKGTGRKTANGANAKGKRSETVGMGDSKESD